MFIRNSDLKMDTTKTKHWKTKYSSVWFRVTQDNETSLHRVKCEKILIVILIIPFLKLVYAFDAYVLMHREQFTCSVWLNWYRSALGLPFTSEMYISPFSNGGIWEYLVTHKTSSSLTSGTRGSLLNRSQHSLRDGAK